MVTDLLLALYRMAREVPLSHFRASAFETIRQRIPFDSANCGTVTCDGIGIVPRELYFYNQPQEEILSAYSELRGEDILHVRLAQNPGITHRFGPEDFSHFGASARFRDHCRAFAHVHVLATLLKIADTPYHTLVVLTRSNTRRPFTSSEQSFVQMLIPHLMEAWLANHAWHLPPADPSREYLETFFAIGSSSGSFEPNPAFEGMIRSEFPAWSSRSLPAEVLKSVLTRGRWEGERIIVTGEPIATTLVYSVKQRDLLESLTSRESVIARHAASGKSYKEIARTLGLSASTVRSHLHKIYAKTHTNNKTSLARVVHRSSPGTLPEPH
ncbi:MAG: helix-turn-helix transcriptional regulator [Steroidobacteraceae bacterium]